MVMLIMESFSGIIQSIHSSIRRSATNLWSLQHRSNNWIQSMASD